MVDKADDPIAMWQQMVGEMQKGFRAFGDQLTRGSPDRTPAGPDSAQKRLADLLESYFAGLNLPSRAQLTGISERLQVIESKLTDITALLQEAVTNSKSAQVAPQALQQIPPQEIPHPSQEESPPQEALQPSPEAPSQEAPQPLQEARQSPQPSKPPAQRPKRPPQAKTQPASAGKGTSAVSKDVNRPK